MFIDFQKLEDAGYYVDDSQSNGIGIHSKNHSDEIHEMYNMVGEIIVQRTNISKDRSFYITDKLSEIIQQEDIMAVLFEK